MAAAIASAMPVLPEVASMSVSPGLIVPRFSASTTIDSAGRSLTDPAGLLPSSFASRTLEVCPGRRCSRTSGVLPTVSSMVRYMARASPRKRILYCTADKNPATRAGFRWVSSRLFLRLLVRARLAVLVALARLLLLVAILRGFVLGRLVLLGLLLGGFLI